MKSHTSRKRLHTGFIKYLLPLITLTLFSSGQLFAATPMGTDVSYPISGKYGELSYTDYGTHVVITACSRSATVVDIPSAINNHPVTTIGDRAFIGYYFLTSIIIPNSVTSIGDGAFSNCYSLTSVSIPNSVTSIGDGAFRNCGFTSVSIPNSVTSIGDGAFRNCGFTSVSIPNSVTSIGDRAFSACGKMTEIIVDPDNSTYSSLEGVLFNKSQTVLIQFPGGKTLSTYPKSVTSLGDWAFADCIKLTSVSIPNSVTSIGNGTFSYCFNLSTVSIANSVTSIGNEAFLYSKMTSISIPSSVTNIGTRAFSGCSNLIGFNVDLESTTYSSLNGVLFNKSQTVLIQYPSGKTAYIYSIPSHINSIGSYAFAYCTDLSSVSIPNSVTSIKDGAFFNCNSLTSVLIPNSVTSIGAYAFYDCTKLTSVNIPNSVTSLGDLAFTNCTNLASISIPDSITSIGYYAFADCTNLTSISIPDSITSIGNGAFSGCSSLSSVSIPDTVSKIEDEVFAGCRSLTGISIPDSVTSIGDDAFSYCTNLTGISIPNSVISIGDEAFYYCESLISIGIPSCVSSIGYRAFSECRSLAGIIVDTDNPTYSSLDGVFFNKLQTVLIHYPIERTASTYLIPNSVISIEDYAFDYCHNLISINLPNSVSSIGDGVFANCTHLISISIPDSVSSIGDETFSSCIRLISVNIPNGVTSIGDHAFSDCFDLSSVSIPNSVTSIGDWAFSKCTSLSNAYFEGNAPTIFGSDVFYETASGFTIYYQATSSGFTSPTWNGYPTSTYEPERILALSGNLSYVNVRVNQAATHTLTIANAGNAMLTVSSIDYPEGFSGDWSGGTIAAGGSQEVTVTFLPTAEQSYTGTITVNADLTSGTNTIDCSSIGTPVSIFQNYDKAYNAWCITGAGFLYDAYYPFVYSSSLESWWYIFDMANTGTDESYFLYDFKTEHFSYTSRSFYPYYFEFDGTPGGHAKMFQ